MSELQPNATILLVDDDPVALELMTLQLVQLGFSDVIACTSVKSAMGIIHGPELSVGLIFCDLQMPDMDGVEFIRHLADIGYTGGVALISGEGARVLQAVSSLAKVHGLRVMGALQKPVTSEQVQDMLSQVHVETPVAPAPVVRQHTPERLRRAIADGELINFYQPKIELASGRLVGVEALVRWAHPQDGLVQPDQLIGLAEEHGLIGGVLSAVLTAALRQVGQWKQAGLDIRVAVNVSVGNLVSLELPGVIARATEEVAVPMSRLILELTESQLMKEPRMALDILTRLRLKRVGLSIDDFGTGYSSLAQLRDIPFDELKMDRGFVHGAWKDESLRAIFEASVGLASRLGMQTVAEGVQDRNDWDFVRQTACNLAQGNFIGRAMPAGELLGWASAWESGRRELAMPQSAA